MSAKCHILDNELWTYAHYIYVMYHGHLFKSTYYAIQYTHNKWKNFTCYWLILKLCRNHTHARAAYYTLDI